MPRAARGAAARERVPATVLERRRSFRSCPGCGRVYWEGSHHARMARLVREVLGK